MSHRKKLKRFMVKMGFVDNPFHRKCSVGVYDDIEPVGRVIEDVERRNFIEGDTVSVTLWKDYVEVIPGDKLRSFRTIGTGKDNIFIVGEYAVSPFDYCPYCLQKPLLDEKRDEVYCPACDY